MILPIKLHSFLIATDYLVFYLLMVFDSAVQLQQGCRRKDSRDVTLTNFVVVPLKDYVSMPPQEDIVPLNPELKANE
jgi:hypothetical protein